eukprot:jgi/Picre1/33548/NNA_008870.t1
MATTQPLRDFLHRSRFSSFLLLILVFTTLSLIGLHSSRRRELPETDTNITCAIVSSAGVLLEAKLGDLIDSHSLVVRFNFAQTSSFEDSVGSRTDIRIFGWWLNISGTSGSSPSQQGSITLNNPRGSEVYYIFRSVYRIPPDNFSLNIQLESLKYMIWYPEYPKKGFKISSIMDTKEYGPTTWSTGFWSLAILPQFCAKITTFGFLSSPKSYQHYDDPNGETVESYQGKNPHPMEWEKSIIDSLVEKSSFGGMVKDINMTALTRLSNLYEWVQIHPLVGGRLLSQR